MCSVVTIGLPFHNAASTLEDAIRSVYAQSFTDWELLIVDDGSADRSLKLVEEIDDAKVKVVADGENKGLASRLNQIAGLAHGEYLARMDADDVMHPQRLERQIDYLLHRPRVGVVGTGMYSMDAGGEPRGVRLPLSDHPGPAEALARSVMIHPTVLGRTSWFRENPYDPTLRRAQDHDLWVRGARQFALANMLLPLMFVREEGTVTISKYAASQRAERRIFRQYAGDVTGSDGAAKLVLKSYAKEWAYRVLCLANAQDILVRRRNQPLDPEEGRRAREVLERIRRTPVPGWSGERVA